MNERIQELNKQDMQKIKKWLSDPVRVLNAFSIFMSGCIVGMIIERLTSL
jgi:chloramphenicol 3-O-phosphotransferase